MTETESKKPTENENETEKLTNVVVEVWEVFKKHELNYDQAIRVVAALVKSIGEKCGNKLAVAHRLVKILDRVIPGLTKK